MLPRIKSNDPLNPFSHEVRLITQGGGFNEKFPPKEFLDIQATIECGFTLKRVRDIIRTYSQWSF